uniref:Uncharacterized protein n=1 Tax=Arundo donax TaxID=35708 RepID=A0A0A9GUE2_ARUDO
MGQALRRTSGRVRPSSTRAPGEAPAPTAGVAGGRWWSTRRTGSTRPPGDDVTAPTKNAQVYLRNVIQVMTRCLSTWLGESLLNLEENKKWVKLLLYSGMTGRSQRSEHQNLNLGKVGAGSYLKGP